LRFWPNSIMRFSYVLPFAGVNVLCFLPLLRRWPPIHPLIQGFCYFGPGCLFRAMARQPSRCTSFRGSSFPFDWLILSPPRSASIDRPPFSVRKCFSCNLTFPPLILYLFLFQTPWPFAAVSFPLHFHAHRKAYTFLLFLLSSLLFCENDRLQSLFLRWILFSEHVAIIPTTHCRWLVDRNSEICATFTMLVILPSQSFLTSSICALGPCLLLFS